MRVEIHVPESLLVPVKILVVCFCLWFFLIGIDNNLSGAMWEAGVWIFFGLCGVASVNLFSVLGALAIQDLRARAGGHLCLRDRASSCSRKASRQSVGRTDPFR